MHYTIELFFDKKTEMAINALFRRLKTDATVRPHLSLCGFQTTEPEKVTRAVRAFASRVKKLSLSFENIGIFPGAGAVFLAPAVTKDLHQLHQGCLKQIRRFIKNLNSYYEVNHLVFHCTLGLGMPKKKMLVVTRQLLELKLPRHFQVLKIGLQRYSGSGPSQTLLETRLAG